MSLKRGSRGLGGSYGIALAYVTQIPARYDDPPVCVECDSPDAFASSTSFDASVGRSSIDAAELSIGKVEGVFAVDPRAFDQAEACQDRFDRLGVRHCSSMC